MHLSWLLLLSAVCVVHGAQWQFVEMIQCVQPGINPRIYDNYGCRCGFKSKGSPVDQLDQCCMAQNKLYFNWGMLAYIKAYIYSCSNRRVTCSDYNDRIQAELCECDRTAAHCIAQYTYNSAYKDYDRKKC